MAHPKPTDERKAPPPAPHAPGGIFKRNTVPTMSRVDVGDRARLEPITAHPPPFDEIDLEPDGPLDWLFDTPGVSGYIHVDADASSYASGGCPEGVEEQLQYLRHLADLVGSELGLGSVTEVHIQGNSARLLHRIAQAGVTTVLTGAKTNTHQVAAQWAGRAPGSRT